MEKIELLAPAGSSDALRAAVENGADAVYLGGNLFSARQYANNFDIEELKDAVKYAHGRNVKIYVAVNTLLANDEFKALFSYLYQLADAQIDAVIVQDLGVAKVINTLLPEMDIHASTQMAIHNSAGLKVLEEMNFSRAVLAREVSFENILALRKQTNLELEIFVHGALCVAYSGQCLMSSMIGGRSGNRGRCAQPCRMKYSLVERDGKNIFQADKIGEHLLSPRDLKMIQHIPQLVEAGIVSLKIEGRMKRPEYVAVVVSNYREAIDKYYRNRQEFSISPQSEKELEQIFNRDFTTGYYFTNQGRDLMSYKRPNNRGLLLGRITRVKNDGYIAIKLVEDLAIGDGYEVWVTKGGRLGGEVKEIYFNNEKISQAFAGQEVMIKTEGRPGVGDRVFRTHHMMLMQRAKESYSSPKSTRKSLINIVVDIREGQEVDITAQDEDGTLINVKGDFIVEKARKHSIDYDTIYKQFSRLGNTPFAIKSFKVNLPPGLMVPISEINSLRRKVVDALIQSRQKKSKRIVPEKSIYESSLAKINRGLPQKRKGVAEKPKLSVLVGNYEALMAAVDNGANQVIVNLESFKNKWSDFTFDNLQAALEIGKSKNIEMVLKLPPIISQVKIPHVLDKYMKLTQLNFSALLVGNLGGITLAKKLGFNNIFADYTLNIFNDYTISSLIEKGIKQLTLSPELTIEQIKKFRYIGNSLLEVIVHGNFPLMVSEYCALGSILGDKDAESSCKRPCIGKSFGLKDRMNFLFPIEVDENCRMLIYNAKALNLYKDIKTIFDTGVNVIRIEGRKEDANYIKVSTQAYRAAIDSWYANKEWFQPQDRFITALEKIQEEDGFTTGHYFRGVQ